MEGRIQHHKKFASFMNGLVGSFQWSFSTVIPPKCCQIDSWHLNPLALPEVFSQLATCQLAPGPFEECPCTHGHQTGHRNKPQGKQTEEEWTVK